MDTKTRRPERGAPPEASRRPIGARIALPAALGAVLLGASVAWLIARGGEPTTTATAVAGTQGRRVPVVGYEVVNVYPHDPDAFTQGLEFDGGVLYEGTGKPGESRLRRVELETGKVLRERPLPAEVFGEGITLWGKTIIQLTWRHRVGYVFDRETFEFKKYFRYEGEGWGLTHDATHLIMSDGTSTLRFLDPVTFRVDRRLRVTASGRPLNYLNELEYIDGEIYANVWQSDLIARIDPATGHVVAWVDLSGLRPRSVRDPQAVLNGIAHDAEGDRLFVTGKDWPKLFEIRLTRPEGE